MQRHKNIIRKYEFIASIALPEYVSTLQCIISILISESLNGWLQAFSCFSLTFIHNLLLIIPAIG